MSNVCEHSFLVIFAMNGTVPRAGTLIGTLKAKVPSRDMGLTTDIHPCAQIVSEWLSAMSYNAYMLAKRASAGEVAYFGACHF